MKMRILFVVALALSFVPLVNSEEPATIVPKEEPKKAPVVASKKRAEPWVNGCKDREISENYNETNAVKKSNVADKRQVALKAIVAEVDRSAGRAIGLQFSNDGAAKGFGIAKDGKFAAAIETLKKMGLARIVAEPTLIALNGQSASFQSGGQFPIVVTGERNLRTQYIPYGLQVSFTPTISANDRINIYLQAVESKGDIAAAAKGLPELITQSLESTFDIRAGQVLAFTGFIKCQPGERSFFARFCDLQEMVKGERELVMLITAELVYPLEKKEIVTASATIKAQTPTMNLADVAALASSGISDEVILNQLRITGAKFTIATEDILFLKRNQVSDRVIIEMQNSGVPLPKPLPSVAPGCCPVSSAMPTVPEIEPTPVAVVAPDSVGRRIAETFVQTAISSLEIFVDLVRRPFPINSYDSDPNVRMRQLLQQSEDFRQIREEKARFWFTNSPSNLKCDRLSGSKGP